MEAQTFFKTYLPAHHSFNFLVIAFYSILGASHLCNFDIQGDSISRAIHEVLTSHGTFLDGSKVGLAGEGLGALLALNWVTKAVAEGRAEREGHRLILKNPLTDLVFAAKYSDTPDIPWHLVKVRTYMRTFLLLNFLSPTKLS